MDESVQALLAALVVGGVIAVVAWLVSQHHKRRTRQELFEIEELHVRAAPSVSGR